MIQSFVKYLEKPVLNNPTLIVGLPGIGNVGKIAAKFLISELAATKFGILYSPHLPYQVLVSEEGLTRLLCNEFYYSVLGRETSDLIILTGDFQSQTIFGQYEIAEVIMDFCKEFDIKKIITIGGFITGNIKENLKVYGAVSDSSLNSWIVESAVEPCDIGVPIVGAAGLLIGLAKLKEIDGICLLGETSGYTMDARAAKAVLDRIKILLKLEIDLAKLDEMDQESQEKIDKIKTIEKKEGISKNLKEKFSQKEKDLSYFG
jgi:uncharacterized protein (TIGR00162 family)